jgi:hypothetical protein
LTFSQILDDMFKTGAVVHDFESRSPEMLAREQAIVFD